MYAPNPSLVYGMFEYKADDGSTDETLVFQFNPSSLKRSRNVTVEQTSAPNPQGTTEGASPGGTVGQKYSARPASWSISFKLLLDSTLPQANPASTQVSFATYQAGIEESVRKLETLVERCGPPPPRPRPRSTRPTSRAGSASTGGTGSGKG